MKQSCQKVLFKYPIHFSLNFHVHYLGYEASSPWILQQYSKCTKLLKVSNLALKGNFIFFLAISMVFCYYIINICVVDITTPGSHHRHYELFLYTSFPTYIFLNWWNSFSTLCVIVLQNRRILSNQIFTSAVKNLKIVSHLGYVNYKSR